MINRAHIDLIGDLYRDDATCDAEGNQLTPPTKLAGFHVNVTVDAMTEALEPFRRDPPMLRRVWAGDDPAEPEITVPLRFADEAEALEILGLAL